MGSSTTYTYNAFGDLITESIDNNSNGVADSVITYDILSFYLDFNYIYTYDAKGNLLSDSVFYTATYDNKGNLTSVYDDLNNDGSPYDFAIYTYDTEGNLVSEKIDYEDDGNFVSVSIYTYDFFGNRTSKSKTIDYGNYGGIVNFNTIYTYDAKSNLISESIDNNGDRKADSITTYTYKCQG
ncbi:hypothetical protein WKK05_02960 [Nostoc sp. UHCC 0302]|uniref:hypothetical protein n=1 Tax=Nostoc sp. UHCC 0302 TaxID=3134896 RepID=UPI00311CA9ED